MIGQRSGRLWSTRRRALKAIAIAITTPLAGCASAHQRHAGESLASAETAGFNWRSFVYDIPKAELHVHVEGMIDPPLAFELAERNGLTLPFANPEAFAATLQFSSLESFLEGFDQMVRVLVTAEDFRDAALHYFKRAAAQNIVYAEIHFDTQPHIARGVALRTVLERSGWHLRS